MKAGRGRPRVHDASVPAHIDQRKIPAGAYWSRQDRHWYTIITEGDRRRRRKLAGAEAKLSELHRLLEAMAGQQRDTLGWLCGKYQESDKFSKLAPKTREDYDSQLKTIQTWRTRTGVLLKDLPLAGISSPYLQRVIDKIGAEHPSKANHLLRYVRRVFSWGMVRGHCHGNPARGLEQAEERKMRRLPGHDVHARMLAFAQAKMPTYVWVAMELAYLCRLRGIEVITLTDAHASTEGVQTNRRKGSRDSLVLWSPRLQAAWNAAKAERARIWGRLRMTTPMAADQRPILVNTRGAAVNRHALSTIWQTMMIEAIKEGVIAEHERFGLHDFKRKGVTDTKGTRAEKREGSGHRTEAMMDVYDLSVPRVTTPGDV